MWLDRTPWEGVNQVVISCNMVERWWRGGGEVVVVVKISLQGQVGPQSERFWWFWWLPQCSVLPLHHPQLCSDMQ